MQITITAWTDWQYGSHEERTIEIQLNGPGYTSYALWWSVNEQPYYGADD